MDGGQGRGEAVRSHSAGRMGWPPQTKDDLMPEPSKPRSVPYEQGLPPYAGPNPKPLPEPSKPRSAIVVSESAVLVGIRAMYEATMEGLDEAGVPRTVTIVGPNMGETKLGGYGRVKVLADCYAWLLAEARWFAEAPRFGYVLPWGTTQDAC